MHLHFERIQKPSSYCDCNLSSLSWMGKVPDGLLQNEDEGWKLNRTNYYQDGWLATGNIRGIVGVTFTTCRSRKNIINDLPQRTNYNLRGHRSEVTLVKWNEPYQKLASCDSTGIIFVWIKYEGRWSIELINDRNTQVTDFSWSHDGRMALICYMDGFVLVGSVSGQRYWSSMLNLDSCTISCGIWSPDDQQVIFGTSSGHILVIDVHGTMVAQVSIQEGIAITHMSWSCEKFKMEDSDEEQREKNQPLNDTKTFALAVSFIDGTIHIMRNYDDIFPIIIRTGLLSTKIEWSNNGEILAIAGHKILNTSKDSNGEHSFTYHNIIQFYTINGVLRLTTTLDFIQYPITAITWGHSDKRLFIATGPVLYIAWITKRIPSLQLLSKLAVYLCLKSDKSTELLPLPSRLQNTVSNLFGQTLQCYLPDLSHLREFVSSPPNNNIRLHCTMIRHEEDIVNSNTSYILYLEYLGGLVPILKGKRASKLKPEFIIFDPQLNNLDNNSSDNKKNNSYNQQNGYISPSHRLNSSPYGTSSDSEMDEPFSGRSPQTRRTRRFRHFRSRSNESSNSSLSSNNSTNGTKRDTYVDDMPEYEKLVLVTSNIWGTKFKILGLSSWLPSQLGSINYRTSLLHLQPRQMTLAIKELGDKRADSISSINKFENNNNFMSSDSEDEIAMASMLDEDSSAPIAPMTPKKNIRYPNQIVSPEKRSNFHFYSSGQSSSSANPHLDYNNFVPNINEEMLTLQINGDSHCVSMEMTGPPITTMSTSISTQTSFQSITELLNALSNEKNTQTLFSPLVENKTLEEQTEETFSRIAKRFASELPSSYYSVNRFESLHSPAIINTNNTSANDTTHYPHLASGQSISPNVSPPKGIRYKIIKKESPRKASVSCIESDLTASRSCDTTSLFPCSPKSQRRCPATLVSSTPSASSTWGGVSVLHCSNSFADTLAIDSKSILMPNISNDFKFIDDFEGEDSVDSRSSSVLFQKNRSICHMQPTIGSEFTNVRTGSDNGMGHNFGNHTFQRRLTLRANKQSHSCETSETPTHNLEKTRNCVSFEEEEEEDRIKAMGTSSRCSNDKCSENLINTNNINDCIERPPKSKIISSNLGINSCSTTSPMTSSEPLVIRSKKKATFNFDNIGMTSDGVTPTSIPSRSYYRLKSCEVLRDESTDTPNSSSPARLHHHRGSLPQAIPSTSANSMNTSSATTVHNRSLPASPLLGSHTRRKAQGKGLFYSPMMLRKVMKQKLNYLDCSSEDDNTSDDDETAPEFRNLESFQKQHFRKKFKVKRRGSRIKPEMETSPKKQTVCYREFILHNKAPLWNEVSQVYQLDFGGRVTQESAKNFQIEYQGKQVMQFGRIDGNAYTLDFQYPFCALQALAVALANVTQRLK